jgi:RimJ/RimL family protein N-acetyltransferase
MSAEFETERLLVEPLDFAVHEEELAALHADARVMANLGGTRSREENRAWIEKNVRHADENGFGVFVFRDRLTRQFVGRGAIRHVEVDGSAEIEVGYTVVAELWGQGLATEMGAWLVSHATKRGLPELVAFTLPQNSASRRVIEKLEFAFEREVVWEGSPHVLYRRRARQRL